MTGNETRLRPNGTQSVAYTGTAGTIASGVGTQTYTVRVWVSTDAFIAIGSSPAATTSDMPLGAGGNGEYISIHPGEKVSALQQNAGGTLYVTEMV